MQWLGGGVVQSIKARWRHPSTQQQQEMAASLDTETAAMETEVRAPLASQEATATPGPGPAPAPALCGQVSEFTRGKEFKVKKLGIYIYR